MNAEATETSRRGLARSVRWLGGVYLVSGACSLIDEVVWVRLLKLTLGNTVYATSVVVSVFLGGLALGALIMARRADRVRRPLRLYALLETLVAATALLLPWGLRLADAAYVWLYQRFDPSAGRLLGLQALLSAAVLAVPTLLMGSTLPLLAAHVARAPGAVGRGVGRLYALNMLGAAAGTFLAGFVLLRVCGVWGTLYSAAGLNLLVALAAWKLAGKAAPAPAPASVPREPARPPARAALLLAAIFASGFVSIGYEIVWVRSIVHLLGADTYVFASVLTVYLAGNVAGAWIGSRLAGRRLDAAAGFGATLALLGLAGLLYLPALSLASDAALPAVSEGLGRAYARWPALVAAGYPLGVAAILLALPAVLMGAGFPLALEAWHGAAGQAGRATGVVYGVNTLAAVAGGLAVGFAVLPGLGVQGSAAGLGLLATAAGAALLAGLARRRAIGRVAAALAAGAAACALLAVPGDLFRRRFVTFRSADLVAVREGPTTTVSVHREANGDLWLCTSGIQVGGDRAKSVQRMLGHLGPLLHPAAKSVLSVGFGTGETARCLSLHEPQRLDCVEISPELVELSLEHFRHINLADRLEGRVNLMYMDAKNYLHLTRRRYDLIVNDSIHPKCFAENASLYTREHFAGARDRLNAGGLFLCWVPFNLPEPCFRSILGTFQEVFPHAAAWFPTPMRDHFVLLAGSAEPLRFSPAHVARELARPGVGESLAGIGIREGLDLFSCYLGETADLRRCAGAYSANTDMRPFVEFVPRRFLDDRQTWAFFARLLGTLRSNSLTRHLDWAGFDGDRKSAYLADLDLRHRIDTALLKTYSGPESPFRRASPLAEPAEADALLADLGRYLARHGGFVEGYNIRGAIWNRRGRHDRAVEDFTAALGLDPRNAFAWHNRGVARTGLGRPQEALADYDRAVGLKPDYYLAYNNRALALHRLGRHAEAVADFGRALRLRPRGYEAYVNRGSAQAALGRTEAALADFARAAALRPDRPDAFHHRAALYLKLHRLDEAVADLTRAIERDPDDDASWNNRGSAYHDQGRLDRAIADYGEAIRLHPRSASAWSNRGLARADKGDPAGAIADYDEALRLEPKRADVHYNRGTAFFQRGDCARAAADYTRAVELDPHELSYRAARAAAEFRRGRHRQAWEDIRRCEAGGLRVDPDLRAAVRAALAGRRPGGK